MKRYIRRLKYKFRLFLSRFKKKDKSEQPIYIYEDD